MRFLNRLATILFVIVLSANSAVVANFTWPLSTPETENIDPDMISTLVSSINDGVYGTQKSLLILRHGKLVHEQYFNGNDQDDLMAMYSASKSWGSALLGVAIRQGDLENEFVPIEQVFPAYANIFMTNPQKQNIRVHDVLTMRHGLAWDEWSTFFTDPANPVNQMTQSSDWWKNVLERPMTTSVDKEFRYSTGTSNLMGGAIYNLTGKSAIEYSVEHLFTPMNILDYYFEVDIRGGPRGSGITDFQIGLTPTGHGMWLKSRDMAKIGQLYLDNGTWESRRLLASEWIRKSWNKYSDHQTDPETFGESLSYGYQWWTFDFNTTKGTVPVHLAWGWADQYIFVIPSLDVVVVTTADNTRWDGPTMISAIRDIVISGLNDDFDPVSDGAMTGSWFSPDRDRQGFMLEVVPSTGQVVIYWMTYEPETQAQQWLVAVGQMHGRRAVLEFLRPQGGSFDGDVIARMDEWGDVELTFQSCTKAKLNFLSEIAGVEGVIDLVRLTPVTTCTDQP